jgi:hypothetical protein
MTDASLKELQRKATSRFSYVACKWTKIPKKKVQCVEFDVGRYGKNRARLFFPKAIGVQLAVKAAEDFLSEDLPVEFFDTLKNTGDVFASTELNDFCDPLSGRAPHRGSVLGSCVFLESLSVQGGSVLEIGCGS